MAEKFRFQEKLAEILKMGELNGQQLEKDVVVNFFEEDQLTAEQLELVFDYLLSQKVIVKGYVKAGGVVTAAAESEVVLSEEERNYLKIYEEDLHQMPQSEMKEILIQISEQAKSMERGELFIGDLIQEGNMGFVLAAEDADTETKLLMARQRMEALIESQNEVKIQDKKMVEKVNDLDDQIKKLTEEMGRKVSVDELTDFLSVSEEEVSDILRLAGEELPEEESE